MKKLVYLILMLLGVLPTAQASPVDVSYTVSGSAGNWALDFSITNNLGSTYNIYLFGVLLPTHNVVASPTGWFKPSFLSANPSYYGGSNTDYNNLWLTAPAVFGGTNFIAPGQTLSAFQAISTAATLPTSVSWEVISAGPGSHPFAPAGCSFICNAPYDNPGFEGLAVQAVPEPAAAWLFGSGLLVLVGVARRRLALRG